MQSPPLVQWLRSAACFAVAAASLSFGLPAAAADVHVGQRVNVTLSDAQAHASRTVVRHGDRLVFCNRDTIQHRLFSIDQAMAFEAPQLRPGECWELPVDNPGDVARNLRINSRIHMHVFLELLVLPDRLPAFPAGGSPQDCQLIGEHCACRPAPQQPRGVVEGRFCAGLEPIGLRNCAWHGRACLCSASWRSSEPRSWHRSNDETCREAERRSTLARAAPPLPGTANPNCAWVQRAAGRDPDCFCAARGSEIRDPRECPPLAAGPWPSEPPVRAFEVIGAVAPAVVNRGARQALTVQFIGTPRFPVEVVLQPRPADRGGCFDVAPPRGWNCVAARMPVAAAASAGNLVIANAIWCDTMDPAHHGEWTMRFEVIVVEGNRQATRPVPVDITCNARNIPRPR